MSTCALVGGYQFLQIVEPRHRPVVVCGPHVISVGVDALAGRVGVLLVHDFLYAGSYPVNHLHSRRVFGRGVKGNARGRDRYAWVHIYDKRVGAVATDSLSTCFFNCEKDNYEKSHTCCVP